MLCTRPPQKIWWYANVFHSKFSPMRLVFFSTLPFFPLRNLTWLCNTTQRHCPGGWRWWFCQQRSNSQLQSKAVGITLSKCHLELAPYLSPAGLHPRVAPESSSSQDENFTSSVIFIAFATTSTIALFQGQIMGFNLCSPLGFLLGNSSLVEVIGVAADISFANGFSLVSHAILYPNSLIALPSLPMLCLYCIHVLSSNLSSSIIIFKAIPAPSAWGVYLFHAIYFAPPKELHVFPQNLFLLPYISVLGACCS